MTLKITFKNDRERRDVAAVLVERAEALMGEDEVLADLLSRVAEDIWRCGSTLACPACGEIGGEYQERLTEEYQGAEGHGGMVSNLEITCSRCSK